MKADSTRQDHIVNYLMVNLSKKGVTMAKFAEASGIDQVSLSKTKKEATRHLVSSNAWEFLDRIYEAKAFDVVMGGGYGKFIPSKGVRSTTPAPGLEKPIPSWERKIRMEEKQEKKTALEKPINPEEFNRGMITDLSYMKIKKLSKTAVPLREEPNENHYTGELHVLHESQITVGMAIDALIKAGAKISITLEA